MSHGTPDWGLTAGTVTTYQLTDLAELAARLGSPDRFDRRGDVLFLDTFGDGLGHWTIAHGLSGGVDLTTTWSFEGRYSARLNVPGALTSEAAILRYMPYPVLSRFGLEVGYVMVGDLDSVLFTIEIWDGSNRRFFQLKYDPLNLELSIYDAALGFVVIASNLFLLAGIGAFHVVKLVVDSANDAWSRVLVDSSRFAPPNPAAAGAPIASAPYLSFSIAALGINGSGGGEVLLGYVIGTQNEPP